MEADNRGALRTLLETSMWELPMAMQKWMCGMADDSHEVEDAVLKACQAWTDIANQSMERVFQAQGFVGLVTGSVKHMAQCQRVVRDLIESMVPGKGVLRGNGDAPELAELKESVTRLRREVRSLTARLNLVDRREAASAD